MSAPDPFAEMRSPVVPLASADEAAAQRSRVVARMEGLQKSVLRNRGARPRSRGLRLGAALGVAAAVAGAWLLGPPLAFAPPRAGAVVESDAKDTSVTRGDRTLRCEGPRDLPLELTDRVRSREGAALRLGSGARVRLIAGTDVRLIADRETVEEVALDTGRVEVSVPRLEPGNTLVVRTVDAAVTVRGTRFAVSHDPACRARPCTAVEVFEGRVEVAHEGGVSVLNGGDVWPAAPPPPPPPQVAAATATAIHAAEGSHSVDLARLGKTPAAHHGTLAEENALLERAMTASRAGQHGKARELFEEHLRAYPRSPLSRNAALEHLRATQRSGTPEAARAAARRYLARYPQGMGTDEARRIAVEAAREAVVQTRTP